ncbi:MAG TPA: OsmC family protein [Burkholderiaceae bacterium]|nr:OsmC family protein [Burkholderiaceae bacterium]
MEISARVINRQREHQVTVTTSGNTQSIAVAAKASGAGSAVNGGEFPMLALATCYCNDLYREAARLGVRIDAVEVEASADFDGIGLAGKNVRYRARIDSPEPAARIEALLAQTDVVAEVHNTLRAGTPVVREPWSGS